VVRVISVAMLGGGGDAAAYYLDKSAECDLAEYYAGEVEAPGRWCGQGAAALGLDGPITATNKEVFAGLLAGRLPDGTVVARPVWRADPRGQLPAEPLVRELRRIATAADADVRQAFDDPQLADRAETLTARIDAASPLQRAAVQVDALQLGELAVAAGLNPHVLYPAGQGRPGYAGALRFAGAKVDARRSGLDIVVSAPKSVSVLYGLSDTATATVVAAAHERAVAQALEYLQRHTSHGIRGHHGGGQSAQRIATHGFVAAAFTHRASRADDPQLHTHLVVANLLQGVDGKWSAVDSRAVHRHARTAGCIYQAVLRGELTRTLGVGWGPIRKGVAEITGIPAGLRRAFSTRRADIETELDRTGGTGRRAAQRAAYRTRPAKMHLGERPLRERWADRARALGHDPQLIVATVLSRIRVPTLPDAGAVAAELFGPDGLTARTTSFDRRDVIQALTESMPVGLPITAGQLEAAADRMLTHRDAIRLLHPAGDRESGARFSSVDLLAAEHAALRLAATSAHVPVHTDTQARSCADGSGLSGEQHTLVIALLTSPRLVDAVVGPAGSGKTALLRTAASGWRDLQVPVIGCALAAVTARRLEAATGIPTSSITRLLADARRPDPITGQPAGLPVGAVVVVDEASMVGTRHLAALTRHVAVAGGKLVCVGDPAQLPEINAGGLFAALIHRGHALTLTGNQRQHHSWERDALLALRAGNIEQALDAYFTHQRIRIGTDAADARKQLVQAYAGQRIAGGDPFDLVALASTRNTVAALNTEIRTTLRTLRLLSPRGITVHGDDGPREFTAEDLVIVTRNDHQRSLLNGTRAVVTATGTGQIALRTDTGTLTTVPTDWAATHLEHGYALTVHKAQGLTTSIALVYGTAALNQQAGYVALSRGRTGNYLFTSIDNPAGDDHDLDVPRFRVLRHDTINARDDLTRRLTRTRTQALAYDQQPQPNRDHWHDIYRYHQPPGRDGHDLSL
jgi:conjugative relaxase-like TrwC/TraI family protein